LKTLREKVAGYSNVEHRKILMQIDELLGNGSADKPDPGDAWADRALSDLAAMTPEAQSAWSSLFAHAATADGSKPSVKWQAEAARHRQAVGNNQVNQHLSTWFSLVAPPPAFTGVAPKYEGTDSRDNGPVYTEYLRAYTEYSEALRK